MGAWGTESDANDAVMDEVYEFMSEEYLEDEDEKEENKWRDLTPEQADDIFDKISPDTPYESLLRTGTIIHMLKEKPSIVSQKQVQYAIKSISKYLDADDNSQDQWKDFEARKNSLRKELAMLTSLAIKKLPT